VSIISAFWTEVPPNLRTIMLLACSVVVDSYHFWDLLSTLALD